MATTPALNGAAWKKGSRSNGNGGNNCVEVAFLDDGAAVRDSKHPEMPALLFAQADWDQFVASADRGELDAPATEREVAKVRSDRSPVTTVSSPPLIAGEPGVWTKFGDGKLEAARLDDGGLGIRDGKTTLAFTEPEVDAFVDAVRNPENWVSVMSLDGMSAQQAPGRESIGTSL